MLGMANNLRIGCKSKAPDTLKLFYENGVEYVDFEAGYCSGAGSQSKEATYLQMVNTADTSQFRGNVKTYVSSKPINVTDLVTIKAICTCITENATAHTRVGIARFKDEAIWSNTVEAEFSQTLNGPGEDLTQTLFVNTLSGMYYIIVSILEAATTGDTTLRVSKIWAT
jgi:hypothetical protein